ncbi:MAG: response regulator transcription factor [Phycisphaerae bacterium]|jgi:DNA-binding response OmpR family regulator
MRVLLIEDYEPLAKAVANGLRDEGYAVDVAADGESGWWYASSGSHDAVILDLMLPKLDGLSLLERIRARKLNVPVLILTARDTVDDRVRGLNCGADDYLVKPFAFAELLARVRAMVRRKYAARGPILSVADLEIDTAARLVTRAGRRIELTAREYALLEFLALRAGQVVSRTEIWEHVYDFHDSPASNVVDVYVGYLRRKLNQPGAPPLIRTRRGQGYVLGEPG